MLSPTLFLVVQTRYKIVINLIFLQNIAFSPINKTDYIIEKDIIHIILTNEYWDVPQKDVCMSMDKNPLGII